VVSFVPGTCVIGASQSGNSNWAAAPTVTHSFVVNLAPQTVTFSSSPGARTVGGPGYSMTATSSIGQTITYSSGSPAVCSVTGNVASFVAIGTCVVNAQAAATALYSAGTNSQNFAVSQGTQSVSFTNSPTSPTVLGTHIMTASATSGLAISSFTSQTPFTCSVAGSVVTFNAVGTCTVTATQSEKIFFSNLFLLF
jgi:hypothetical protein